MGARLETFMSAIGHQAMEMRQCAFCGKRIAEHLNQCPFCREMVPQVRLRSEEHTSELQSQSNLVCRLLLEKKKEVLVPHEHTITTLYSSFVSAVEEKVAVEMTKCAS